MDLEAFGVSIDFSGGFSSDFNPYLHSGEWEKGTLGYLETLDPIEGKILFTVAYKGGWGTIWYKRRE